MNAVAPTWPRYGSCCTYCCHEASMQRRDFQLMVVGIIIVGYTKEERGLQVQILTHRLEL